jgi:predicted RNA binding protein YcfA (HicA-like mRNA interferase family)
MKIFEILESIDLDEAKIPTSKELKKALLKKGYTPTEGGEHTKFHAPDRSHHISMPRGPKPLSIGLAKSVMKTAGLTDADW